MSRLTVYENGLTPSSPGTAGCRLPDEDQIKLCTAWLLLHALPTPRISRKATSYHYKHRVERWTHATGPHRLSDVEGNRWTSDYYYVSNGALIEAALRLGYVATPTHAGSPNAYFNFRVKPERR